MRRSLVALLAVGVFPGGAAAAPVLVLGHHGRVTRRSDPYLTGPAVTPAPGAAGASAPRAAAAPPTATRRARPAPRHRPSVNEVPALARRTRARRPAPVTVGSELARLQHAGEITAAVRQQDTSAYAAALRTERRLHGTRRSELSAVTTTIHELAAAHTLSPTLLPEVFATLAANVQWWSTGPLLSPGQRVEFAGSQLVWEYYPGQGIQLQVLGTFGKADGLYTAGPSQYPAMEQLLSEIIPLAAQRGGGLAWEYLFHFDGGSPPWVSAMAQGTALEALGRAYRATGDVSYAQTGASALGLFGRRPPVGVATPATAGTRFLQYSFAPRTDIINAFLQTLIGLDDFATATGNPRAGALFAAGEAEARAELPSFDTGAWSLYQPGVEDDLGYHELVIGFLQGMCQRTSQPVYCTTAQHFEADLRTPPVVSPLTRSGRAERATTLRFALSKVSRVGIELERGAGVVFATSAQFSHGIDTVTLPAQPHPGSYTVHLHAVDLAGNAATSDGALRLTSPPRPAAHRTRARSTGRT